MDPGQNEMFEALCHFKAKCGHCGIPAVWCDHPALGKWVVKQRVRKREGSLSSANEDRLDKIGFIWDPNAAFWIEMFNELVRFQQTYGHCNVPKNWSQNPKLGSWVDRQRWRRKKGSLSTEHEARLNEIGFEWSRQ